MNALCGIWFGKYVRKFDESAEPYLNNNRKAPRISTAAEARMPYLRTSLKTSFI